MRLLPTHLKLLFSLAIVFSLALVLTPKDTHAASAYISPEKGEFTKTNPKLPIYVESYVTEPEMSGATIVLTLPDHVCVDEITDGDFDSYLEKDYQCTPGQTNQVTISAVANAGNYKSGKVLLASVRFDIQEVTEYVEIEISPTSSEITGADGEQLLTETVNGFYTLNIPNNTPPVQPIGDPISGNTAAQEITTTKGGLEVPETGPAEDIALYLIVSSVLIGFGYMTLKYQG